MPDFSADVLVSANSFVGQTMESVSLNKRIKTRVAQVRNGKVV